MRLSLLLLGLFCCSLVGSDAALAQSTFATIITDQPDFESQYTEAAGLPDGGRVAAGYGLLITSDPLAPTQAVLVERRAMDGTLL